MYAEVPPGGSLHSLTLSFSFASLRRLHPSVSGTARTPVRTRRRVAPDPTILVRRSNNIGSMLDLLGVLCWLPVVVHVDRSPLGAPGAIKQRRHSAPRVPRCRYLIPTSADGAAIDG